MVCFRPSSSPRSSERRVRRESPAIPRTSGTAFVSANQNRRSRKSPRVQGPVRRIGDGGTSALTSLLLLSATAPVVAGGSSPPIAHPAHLHVSIGGLQGYLSTAALDGASNRPRGHDPFARDRKPDRDPPVGRGGLEIRSEVVVEIG